MKDSIEHTKLYTVICRNIFSPIILVTETLHECRKVHVCDTCSLGYDDIRLAYACEQYHREYRDPSSDIVKRATYRPLAVKKNSS